MGDLSAHFSKYEFICKCHNCLSKEMDPELIEVLEFVRQHFGGPIIINSGYRCLEYNRSIGSDDTSQHPKATAADFTIEGVRPNVIATFLNYMFTDKYGIGTYDGFTHIDVRKNKARWDKRTFHK